MALNSLNYLNLVELFKTIAIKLNNRPNDEERSKTFARIGIDIFICLKWFIIIMLWSKAITNFFWTILIWYLIIANVYSYFYNHIWTDEALNTENFTKDRIRSRFLNLMLAVAYSTFCFGYFYQVVYPFDFYWAEHSPSFYLAIQYSFSNSLAANFEQIKPVSDIANQISNLQLAITFIFVTIILSKSIPQTNSIT
ncbi:MAG: hypothetical protein JNK73_13410 [Bacteroidia bacterium]|nr:hypothetical protein [Bacteroidia bacterium]